MLPDLWTEARSLNAFPEVCTRGANWQGNGEQTQNAAPIGAAFWAPKGHWPPVVTVAGGRSAVPTADFPAGLSLFRSASLAVALAGRLLLLADSFSEAAGTSLAPIL